MIALPSFPSAAPAAVRRPLAAVDFGGDWSESLLSVTVDCALAPGVDRAAIRLAAGPDAPSPAVGDTGTIALGYEDGGTEVVFTGAVDSVAAGVHGVIRVVAANAGSAIARVRVNRAYEQQKAGDVVSDLAGEAGASTGDVRPGADLAFFVVDDRRGGWTQVAELAALSGCLAYVTPAGEVTMAPPPAGPPATTFAYAVDVLELAAGPRAPVVGALTVIGEGAAGSQGADAWSWFVKDPAAVTGTGAGSGPARRRSEPALRSTAAVQAAALGVPSGDVAGHVRVAGAQAVAVGGSIMVSGAGVDVPLVVRGVRHRFSRAEGFTTRIDFVGAGL
jgi:phage protein D